MIKGKSSQGVFEKTFKVDMTKDLRLSQQNV